MSGKKQTFRKGLTDIFGGATALAVPSLAWHHELATENYLAAQSPLLAFNGFIVPEYYVNLP
jgi:hypothetical protein